jgi:NAD(P)-dependent dehydrogenase (short-subunit alcohol dehydrogenase family)
VKLNLTAKTAVVTGTSRGIGLGTVRTLIDEGVQASADYLDARCAQQPG